MLWRATMFNPSELEGEVDHSFFDSDFDSRSEHKETKEEQHCKVEEQSQAASLNVHTNSSESTTGDRSLRTESSENVDQIWSHTKSIQTKSSRKGRSRITSASTASRRWKGVSSSESSSDCGNDTNLNNKRYKEALTASRVNVKELNDKDVHSQMRNDNQGDGIAFHLSCKKKKNFKGCNKNASPSSTETDADLESCSSRSSSLESHKIPKSINTSNPGLRRNKEEVLGPERLQSTSSDESDYSVTDVSPLSSPDSDKSLPLHQSKTDLIDHEENQEESMPSSGLSNIQQEGSFDRDVYECSSLSLESEFQDKVVIHHVGRRSRKNYSFTNDEVQRIDRENQRLLRELSRLSPGPRPESAMRRRNAWARTSTLAHFSSSAINRQRELQRIQTENLAFLKKLESVKPTPSLKRSEQLADYQRQVAYRGAPSYQICRSAMIKGRTSRITSTGPRSVSSRAALTTDSDSTLLPRQKKIRSPRPAWC